MGSIDGDIYQLQVNVRIGNKIPKRDGSIAYLKVFQRKFKCRLGVGIRIRIKAKTCAGLNILFLAIYEVDDGLFDHHRNPNHSVKQGTRRWVISTEGATIKSVQVRPTTFSIRTPSTRIAPRHSAKLTSSTEPR